MWFRILLLVIGTVGTVVCQSNETEEKACTIAPKGISHFPSNFSFGVATAAYQIEGGWNEDGKGPSIWDDFTHEYPHMIDDKSTGDIAADSYHQFDQDLAALKSLKVNHYRFSISWARIYPTGVNASRNQKGIDYYNDVIDKLLANGIEPMVTMCHFDLPLDLQKYGGFVNSMIIDQFATYANELFQNFGDRVKTWITFNEPLLYCRSGYGEGNYPPQIHASGRADYICIDNTLRAHATVYSNYKSNYFKKQGGKIGIALDTIFAFTNDSVVFDRAMQYNLGIIAHPIFSKSGGYPDILINEIALSSTREKRIESRLPALEGEWKDMVRGSADFLGLNYYSTRNVRLASEPIGQNPSFERDYNVEEYTDPKWKRGLSKWLYCVPEGLEGVLKYIRDEYDNVEVIVTENGWSDKGELNDDGRIQFLKSHLQAVLNAINDGCNVTGYTYWSLLDNFEWQRGYDVKFGMFSVNMSSPNKERSAKNSACYYKNVVQSHSIPANNSLCNDTTSVNGAGNSGHPTPSNQSVVFLMFVGVFIYTILSAL